MMMMNIIIFNYYFTATVSIIIIIYIIAKNKFSLFCLVLLIFLHWIQNKFNLLLFHDHSDNSYLIQFVYMYM